jgi:hypothetical protein
MRSHTTIGDVFVVSVPGRDEFDGVTRCIYDYDCLGVKAGQDGVITTTVAYSANQRHRN